MHKLNSPVIVSATNVMLLLLVFLSCVSRLVPLVPDIHPNLFDSSWRIALNYATSHGLIFGKDIIFTYGPYASVYTREYHPVTDRLMVGGGMIIALCYTLILSRLAMKTSKVWLIIFCIVLISMNLSQDALFILYTLLFSLFIYRLSLSGLHNTKIPSSRLSLLTVIIAFSGLGLLPLIKGSYIPISIGVSIATLLLLWFSNLRSVALFGIGVQIVTSIFLWLYAQQPISYLLGYFFKSMYMFSGYSEAMSLAGDAKQIYLFIVISILICCMLVIQKSIPPRSRFFILVVLALILNTVFKASFVRHDYDHVLIQSSFFLLLIPLLGNLFRKKQLVIGMVILLLTWLYTDYRLPKHTTIADISSNFLGSSKAILDGYFIRVINPEILPFAFNQSLKRDAQINPIPHLDGTTDVYSYGQPSLLASNNVWSPRPIFQSYASYNDKLAHLNALHLIGDAAPDNVLFTIEPIDGRLPTIEDGESLPYLLQNYSISGISRYFLYLKKSHKKNILPKMSRLTIGDHVLGKDVNLPPSNLPLYAEIDVQKTFLGELISALYKPPTMYIQLTLKDGTIKTFRFISTMGRSGFIISPHIGNAIEFAFLFGSAQYLDKKTVTSIRVYSNKNDLFFWNPQFRLKLSAIHAIDTESVEIIP